MNLFTEGCETPENCEKLRQLILTSSCLNSQFLLSKVGLVDSSVADPGSWTRFFFDPCIRDPELKKNRIRA